MQSAAIQPPFTPSTSRLLLSQSSMLQSAPHPQPQPQPPFSSSQHSLSLTQGTQSSRRSSTSGSIFRRGSAAPAKRPRPESSCSSGSELDSVVDQASAADSDLEPQRISSSSRSSHSIAVPAFKSARSLAAKQQATAADPPDPPSLQVDSAPSQAPAAGSSAASKSAATDPPSAKDAKPFGARVHHRQKLARATPIDLTPPAKPSSFIAVSRPSSSEDAQAPHAASAVPLCVNWQPTFKAKRRLRRDQQRVIVSSGFGRKRVSAPSADEPHTVMRVAEVLDEDIAMLEVEVTKQQQQEALIDLTEGDAETEEQQASPTEPAAAAVRSSHKSASDDDEIYWPQVNVHRAVPGVLKKRGQAPAKTFHVRRQSPRTPSPPPVKQRPRKRKPKAPSVRRVIECDPDDDDWIVDDDAVEAEEEAIEAQGFDEAEEVVTAETEDPRAMIKQEFVTAVPEPIDVSLTAAVEDEQKQSDSGAIDSTVPVLTQPPPKLKRLLRLSECIPTLPPMPAFLAVVAPESLVDDSIEAGAAIVLDDAEAAVGVADEQNQAGEAANEDQAAAESSAPVAAAAAEVSVSKPAAPSARRGSNVLHRDANFPVPWINEFSDSPPPAYEHLTDANIETDKVAQIASVHHLFKGCTCAKGKCQATTCECRIRGSAGYSHPGVVRAQTVEGLNLWECGSDCSCSSKCLNRVSQRFGTCNASLPLYIFRHAEEGLGWGVRCEARIDRGVFVGEYMGVLKSEEECCDESVNDEYMFTVFPDSMHKEDVPELEQLLEAHDAASMDELLANWPRVTVDAREAGNVTRFINHSCDPNLVSIQVYSEDRSPHRAKILYFTRVPILAHKELTIDYHYERNPRIGGEWPFVCKSVGEHTCGTVKCQHPTARVRNQMEKTRIDEFLADDGDEE